MEEYGIQEILAQNGIIDQEGKILKEDIFKDFLFGLFLYYFCYERYKWFFDKNILEQLSVLDKGKPRAFYPTPCPFRFVGFGKETLFIGKMAQPHIFFKETINENFFWNYNIIDFCQSILEKEMGGIINWKSHTCSKDYQNRYCKECKNDFPIFASSHLDKLCKVIGIKGYLVLKIPSFLLKGLISQDDFIEVGQNLNVCSECSCTLYETYNYCPNCNEKIDESIFNKKNIPGNPEKIFNECLGLYLSLKKGLNFKANFELDRDFFNEEIDVYLSNGKEIKLIEGTVQFDLDKTYVAKKAKTLNLIESQLITRAKKEGKEPPKCEVIIWDINKPQNVDDLESIPLKIFPDKKITIIREGYEIEESNRLEIGEDELKEIRDSFHKIIEELLEKI